MLVILRCVENAGLVYFSIKSMCVTQPTADVDQSSLASMSDDALLAHIELRQPAALAAFYDRYAGVVLAMCARILPDRSSAEKIVEDVFYELWQRPQSMEVELCPVLHRLASRARTLAIEKRRSQPAQSPGHEQGTVAFKEETGCPGVRAVAAQCRQCSQRARAALATLPPDARQVLEMATLDAWSIDEIACRLKIDPATIRRLLCRGLTLFRDAFTQTVSSDKSAYEY